MAQSIRDQIRSSTLGAKPQFKTKLVDLDGTEVEIRQPNLKDRQKLLKMAKDKEGNFEMISFLLWAVILCTYVPNTNEKVFSEEDYDSMLEMNTGGFVEKLGGEVSALMNEEDTSTKN